VTVIMPALTEAQTQRRLALLDVHERLPTGWTLVGGQMVLGALVAKAAAYTISQDPNRARHLTDFAVLTTLIVPADRIETADKRDRGYLSSMIGALVAEKRTLLAVEDAVDGLETLRMALTPL
jgi:hypothetical protein